ncbi:hypothetical protein HOLleu_27798 [Holothuria leucospilota]|uniref:Uncharacterized protein n=1 Tax=Holothuria leucospilota TaxID=206669 RepID=A0A9Q1BQS8_HOLLE|nr:hypothetical protein HOLleu_27798 [Holothuria leucospilota]
MLEVPDLLVSEINPNDSLAMMRSLRSTTEDSNVIPKVSKVIPPEVSCHHVSIAGKHFLSIKGKYLNVCKLPIS